MAPLMSDFRPPASSPVEKYSLLFEDTQFVALCYSNLQKPMQGDTCTYSVILAGHWTEVETEGWAGQGAKQGREKQRRAMFF